MRFLRRSKQQQQANVAEKNMKKLEKVGAAVMDENMGESPTRNVSKLSCGPIINNIIQGQNIKFGSAGSLPILRSLSLSKLNLGDKRKILKKYKKIFNAKRRFVFSKLKKSDAVFKDVILGKTLGSGGNGTVYMADLLGKKVAVKIVNANTVENVVPEKFMKKIRHPNLIDIMSLKENIDTTNVSGKDSSLTLSWDSLSSGSFTEMAKSLPSRDGEKYMTNETWIMMEYCDSGSLWQCLQKGLFHNENDRRRPKFTYIINILNQIALALSYMHKNGIVHGDVKSQNILMKKKGAGNGEGNLEAKLGDYGHCKKMDKDGKRKTFCWGTVDHMPPEILKDGEMSYYTDVFAFGMVMWECMTALLPFSGLPESSILISIVQGIRPKIPAYIPKEYSMLMNDCWHQDPLKRPSFYEITNRLKKMMELTDLWSMENEESVKIAHLRKNSIDAYKFQIDG